MEPGAETYELLDDSLLSSAPSIDGFKVLDPCILYSRLGRGGMGAVYFGRHLNLEVDVAVKCLHPTLADGNSHFVDMFRREARSAATVAHPNLIRVYDVLSKYGLHYIIMDFVRGETARERVMRKGLLDPEEAIKIVYGAALGMNAAHQKRIIHRDIKPDNIMISLRGQVTVADLGLSKAMNSSDTMTHSQQVMGTPQYMPPEQFEDFRSVGAPGDVYALGATLFFLLTGKDAISPGTPVEMMRAVCDRPFPKIQDFMTLVDPQLARVLARCTAKDKKKRYPTAGHLARELKHLAADSKIHLRDPEAGTLVDRATLVSPPPQRTLDRIKGRMDSGDLSDDLGSGRLDGKSILELARRPWVLGGVGVLVIASVLLFFLQGRGGGDDPASNGDSVEKVVGGDSSEVVPATEESKTVRGLSRLEELKAQGEIDQAYVEASLLEGAEADEVGEFVAGLKEDLLKRLEADVILHGPRNGIVSSKKTVTVEGSVGAAVSTLMINREIVPIPSRMDHKSPVSFSKELIFQEDGAFQVDLVATDRHGISATWSVEGEIDTVAPELTITTPESSDWMKSRQFTVRGTVEDQGDLSGVSVSVAGFPASLDGNRWTCNPRAVDDGELQLTVEARDRAGNLDRSIYRVKVDATPPRIEIFLPDDEKTLRAGEIEVGGSVEDITAVSITVNSVAADVTDDTWSAVIPFEVGVQSVKVVAHDKAGNEVVRARDFTVNAPVAALSWATSRPGTGHDIETGLPLQVIHEKTGIELALISGEWLEPSVPLSAPDGSEKQEPFYIGIYEVSIKQFRVFYSGFQKDDRNEKYCEFETQPAVLIDALQARRFCRRFKFRLPTEAEWEIACRGGTSGRYPWGSEPSGGKGFANVADLTRRDSGREGIARRKGRTEWPGFKYRDGFPQGAPIGSFKPNDFGLYDMIGNVAEWCEGDGEKLSPVRGGSWFSVPGEATCSVQEQKRQQSTSIGFRVARDARE